MHVSVQKSTRTTWPRSSRRPSGAELSQPVAPSSEGMRRRPKTLTASTLTVAPARRTRGRPWSPPRSRSACVGADDAVGEREHHELGARLELQLAHDVGAVRVDRADGDEELLADLLVR